jgi:hypothetical protein
MANEAMHRMSGTHICWRFEWLWLPLIGDLGRSTVTFPGPRCLRVQV